MSSVGSAGVYQADDQRTVPDSEKNQAERYEAGQEHSHLPNDSSAYTTVDLFVELQANTCNHGRGRTKHSQPSCQRGEKERRRCRENKYERSKDQRAEAGRRRPNSTSMFNVDLFRGRRHTHPSLVAALSQSLFSSRPSVSSGANPLIYPAEHHFP
jgi:hypothetical protein